MFASRLYVKLLGIAVSCGIGLIGIRAAADDATPPATDDTAQTRKHAEEMNKGKSHEDARAAAKTSDDVEAQKATAEAQQHAAEMNKGKSHEDARAAAKTPDEAQAAKATRRAKKHAEEMGKGKSHEEAKDAADKQ